MALTDEQKLEAYKTMMVIRRFEEKCAELYAAGDIGGFLHLYIGQEAIALATKYALRDDDNVITAYRDHGLAIARGLPVKNLMAEMLGKATGTSKGKGGSMHLADKEKRFWGGWAIVGGHLPLAAGLALADTYRGEDRVTLALMGDGATNIGYFHESLNMAAVWKLPVVWLVENNQYGMGTAVIRASAVSDIAKKAEAYGMPCCVQVDGMDLQALVDYLEEAAIYAREGKGSFFVEALTYRYRGHSMGDPERYRPVHEVEEKKLDDPISHLGSHLIEANLATTDDLQKISDEADQEIAEAVEFAKNSPFPEPGELYTDIYADSMGEVSR
ncbi:MAG: pyruvate dehydrogenase (acetyl-transferring) E1 component subunit alpha [Anaerolineae bacterium]|nr:pyruvate dehydrogenase (acetyl-transferring) E1 component subunit alpha [Anaerolineae bacterium]